MSSTSITECRTAGLKGYGLFSIKNIEKGTIVAQLGTSARMKPKQFSIFRAALGLPHDACIHVERSHYIVYDSKWTDPLQVPLWYRLNHARLGIANVHMKLLNRDCRPDKQSVVWIASRNIEANEELRFTYTDVPQEWNEN